MRKYKHFILIALLSLLCLSFLPIRSEAVQEATEGMLTDSIRTISVGAFQNCNRLTDLFYAGTQKQLSQCRYTRTTTL